MADYKVKFRSSKRLYHFEYDHPDHDIPLNFMTSPGDSWSRDPVDKLTRSCPTLAALIACLGMSMVCDIVDIKSIGHVVSESYLTCTHW